MATLTPYGEKLISDALREHPSVEALNVRVVGKTPGDTRDPWIRVTQLDAAPSSPEHLLQFDFQADVYAGEDGGQPEANLVMRTVRAVVAELDEENRVADEGVVTGAAITSCARVPDDDFTPSRERFIIIIRCWAHS